MNNKFIAISLLLLSVSCIDHKCFRGIFATEKLLKLSSESINKIISNDTLYVNDNIYLTNSVFKCSEDRTKKMMVIGSFRNSTVLLVPYESDYKNDTLLYVNSQFFISPLDRGLVVTNKKSGIETNYEYPEDDALYSLTKKLNAKGLYKLEDGKFVFLTESVSQDAFKNYCTNATCFVPSPGILYDKKINLNKLKSIDSLEYDIEFWLDNF